MSAFKRYLFSLPNHAATIHILECLWGGGQDSEAWEVMEEMYGPDWSCKPQEMPQYVEAGLRKLREKYNLKERQ